MNHRVVPKGGLRVIGFIATDSLRLFNGTGAESGRRIALIGCVDGVVVTGMRFP